MRPAHLDISVVICAYTEQRWDELCAALASVRAQRTPPREIILVIDHNQRLLERARAHTAGVVVIENQEERGLSGARNSALAIARSAIIAFMDEDALADPDWLEQLATGYADEQVAGVGGVITPLWTDGRPRWFPVEFDWVVGCTYRGLPQSTAPVRNLIGCNMSFRRSVFEAVGGFRNGVGRVGTRPVGCEETELCIRIGQRRVQAVLLYEPRARVHHRVPGTRASLRYFRARCYAEGLSKAQVTGFVGTRDGLASERAYTLRTLPQGVAKGVTDALLHGDPAGLGRAAAIGAGLMFTMTGYVSGRLSAWLAERDGSGVREATPLAAGGSDG